MVGHHNSTKCERSEHQWFLSENQNNDENICNRDGVYFTEEKLLVSLCGWTVYPDIVLFYFYFFHTVFCLPRNYSGTNLQKRNRVRTISLVMEPSHVGLWAPCLLFSFSLSILPHSLSQCSSQYFSLGLLHTDGKLCVYFKNHFATLHIPTLPRSCCWATLTGMLLSGAGTRGCWQPTRPLETIVSLVPESITAVQWVWGLQRLDPMPFFS